MVTGTLKNDIDKIWDIFAAGGITNPLTVIEQFTYLIFIKKLDRIQADSEEEAILLDLEPKRFFDEEHSDFRWSNFKHFPADKMFETFTGSKGLFSFVKTLHGDKDSAFSRYMKDAIFMIPTPQLLEKIVTNIDKIPFDQGDIQGDLYEYLLSKMSTAGRNGQFRTPVQIRQLAVALSKPSPNDFIIDPAAGTAGFLIAAGEYIDANHDEHVHVQSLKRHYNQELFSGFDTDVSMLRVSSMNLMLHGVDNPNINYMDSLSTKNTESERYTLVLANPPFKGNLDYESVSPDLLKVTKTKKTELLFIALMIRLLKKGGRCTTIVPDGVLFGSSKAHKDLRKTIVEDHQLDAIISMPSGIFKPYAGVSTALMLFTKTGIGGTDKVWFYDMKADGYSLDDKRQPVDENDIPDIIERFWKRNECETNRARTEQSFFVDVEEIRENGYDLSINKYKEIVYEKVEYDAPEVIMGRINAIDDEISVLKQELIQLLNLDL